MSLRQLISNNYINVPGFRTRRKIVVIESDDWGAIRMPSRDVYNRMLSEGIRVDRDPYCMNDGLETADDLNRLFEVLQSVRDKNGNHPVITADTVVANPDFESIRKSQFREYSYRPFTADFDTSPRHAGTWEMWQSGMAARIFHPQFHGREHLNVKKWLSALCNNDSITCKSFDYGTFGLTSAVDPSIKLNYMGAFNSALPADILDYDSILTDGLNLFETMFGFRSQTFIATTYTWPCEIEHSLLRNGVKYLQGMVSQNIPLDDDTTFRYKNSNFIGHKSKAGLTYLMRNAYFEPSQRPAFDWTGDCLRRIAIAFRWHKPATISAHRLNFIGSINPRNTEHNLPMFRILLHSIVKLWPDVEFMTSDQLGKIISNGQN